MDEKKRKNLNKELKNFIFLKKPLNEYQKASMGWIYALSYDKEFLIETFKLKETFNRNLNRKIKILNQNILIQTLIFLNNCTVLIQLKKDGITSMK